MRRRMHAILDHGAGALQDDATTMLVEWQAGGHLRITLDRRLMAASRRNHALDTTTGRRFTSAC
jgi:hypothetical protein